MLGTFDVKKAIEEEGLMLPLSKGKTLYVILGLLGDFDSFEYIQSLVKLLPAINQADINLHVLGIGDNISKKIFCDYTKLPQKYLSTLNVNSLHNKLGLEKGLVLTNSAFIDLFIMCLGIDSPGTIKEVLRGYTGDKTSKKLFINDELISFTKLIRFKSDLFNLLGKDYLRPFELASLRLMNLIEVVSKWNMYISDNSFLTQRGGTFLIDEKGKLMYSFKGRGLLGYSETMSNPTEFISKYL